MSAEHLPDKHTKIRIVAPGCMQFDNECCIPLPPLQQFRPVGMDAAEPLTWLCQVRLALPSFSLMVY